MNLDKWAIRHHVSLVALTELRRMLISGDNLPLPEATPSSEAAAQAAVRLEASRAGSRLWRNNNGAGKLDSGSFIRWGLANDSASLNAACKSADLVGIKPVLVTSAHVGTTIGQFLSREIKRPGWRYSGTDREVAQLKWIEILTGMGGDACFATGEGTIK